MNGLFDLTGKVAIVTGATRGLGQGMAIALAKAGANIVGVGQSSLEPTQKEVEKVGGKFLAINLNLKTLFFLSQAVAKEMIEQKSGGKIINIASMLSYQGGIRVPAYTASKSGVKGLTKALANEWAKYNINVNAIAPGYMITDNTKAIREDVKREKEILDRIPAGRWGTPEDLAGAVIFLSSKASNYVNGECIAVDGGWLAR